ncbi:hypothetical protein [Pseudooctadecabacter jejudonensis]|uniref:Uncharacterized protein n=1 Tax=Pseudooctadecabacter jejudonensis TaxID=1391910 RepID=A0A1Y5T9R5_9RHOB|nr:hypothetical protein [Pseudooctadecabacter jejudonensis]SLN58773.1 hypothetical protein PSJ8397_03111 [Pseudooctadecabacter jejudonensis]
MPNWLTRNAPVIEACAAALTAVVAVAALFGVSAQLNAADTLALEQAARDAYRGHLSLAVSHPDFAEPKDVCRLLDSDTSGAYIAFVDHLLYSAELTLDTDSGWASVYLSDMVPHAPYFCSTSAPRGDTESVAKLIATFRDLSCALVPPCD